MDAVAFMEQVFLIRLAVAVPILEPPEPGNAGIPDLASTGEDPRPDPRGGVIESIGEDRGRVGLAVAVAVDDSADSLFLAIKKENSAVLHDP